MFLFDLDGTLIDGLRNDRASVHCRLQRELAQAETVATGGPIT
jgi:phosphoserine phosphatase